MQYSYQVFIMRYHPGIAVTSPLQIQVTTCSLEPNQVVLMQGRSLQFDHFHFIGLITAIQLIEHPKYAFKHLLFSVTDPAMRVKPAGVSDIMWAEAMGKLEGMESTNRERLWPQLVQGFKDLSQRLKLQDEAILSDAERLRMTQTNVKMLQRHFQADTLPWIQRMRQKEQGLQRRLLRLMRIVEALEGKGFRMPLLKGEAELAEKLAALARQLKGSGAELARRVHNLLSISRVHANAGGVGGSLYLPGLTKIHEQSLADMQEVLQQQTEAIARLGNVLKRDVRDMEIIMSEDTELAEDSGGRRAP